ncbi:unnamed protein product [Lactuca saligna]|uniref:Uncharacterized protein n=1 Tax=Lactuca saligna TaxID=75948 RepID=A0AA35V7K3_LACSI|nr:unnamed protein product [Lactuca saligna]
MYVPYPRWLGLIMSYDEEVYNINHGDIIPISSLSSNITNVAPSNEPDDEEDAEDEEYELATDKDTPPNYLGDNPLPPSSNPFSPHSPPYHPPPHTTSLPPGSPPQTDDAKKGEKSQGRNDQEMVTAKTSSLTEMSE